MKGPPIGLVYTSSLHLLLHVLAARGRPCPLLVGLLKKQNFVKVYDVNADRVIPYANCNDTNPSIPLVQGTE